MFIQKNGVKTELTKEEATAFENAREPSLEMKIKFIEQEFDEEVAEIKKGYPSAEIETWMKQEAEAKKFRNNASAETPFLDKVIVESGESKEEFITKILENIASYEDLVASALGRKRKKIAELKSKIKED